MINAITQVILEVSCLFVLAVAVPLAAYAEPEPRVFIAIGDSVSAGFGVDSGDRYTALLFDKLQESDYVNKYVNMGVDGFTASMLLAQLNGLDEESLSLFESAYVITINIGGNDILAPLVRYLPTPEDVVDIVFELWEFIQEAMAMVPYVMSVATEFQEELDNLSIWRLPALNRMIQDALPIFGEVSDMFERVDDLQLVGLLPLLAGEFSPELDTALRSGVGSFAEEFSEIIAWVNAHAPYAVVIVNTVYNPIPKQLSGISIEGLSDRADGFVRDINRVIANGRAANGYLVADVYASFAGEPDNIMNFFVDTSALMLSFDFIHPSAAGHKLIARLNYEAFRTLVD